MSLTLRDLNRVASICFFGRSGSVFLQSLFDGHPDVIMMPGTALMSLGVFWTECMKDGSGTATIISRFIHHYQCLFDGKETYSANQSFDRMGENQNDALFVDASVFMEEMLRQLGETRAISFGDFFRAIHWAYSYALGIDLSHRQTPPLIVYQMHGPNPEVAAYLSKDFSNCYFIHMIRNPVQTLGSHIAHYLDEGMYADLKWTFRGLFIHSQLLIPGLSDRAIAIKLEDLHSHPTRLLPRLCKYLELEWSPLLLQSTFNGLKWWNLKGTHRINGFSEKVTAKTHTNLLSSFDKFRIEVMVDYLYLDWEYTDFSEWSADHGSFAKLLVQPFRFELEHPEVTQSIRESIHNEILNCYLLRLRGQFPRGNVIPQFRWRE